MHKAGLSYLDWTAWYILSSGGGGFVAKLCLTLCDPMDCSPPDSSVHGIFRVRILEWVAISFSRGSSQLRDQTHVSCIGRWILNHWCHLGSSFIGEIFNSIFHFYKVSCRFYVSPFIRLSSFPIMLYWKISSWTLVEFVEWFFCFSVLMIKSLKKNHDVDRVDHAY